MTWARAALSFDSWSEVAGAVAVVGALATVLGVIINAAYTSRKGSLERRAADDLAQDRLIKLIEREAEKRVQVVRLEFEALIGEMRAAHLRELAQVRADFEKQLQGLRRAQNRMVREHPETWGESGDR